LTRAENILKNLCALKISIEKVYDFEFSVPLAAWPWFKVCAFVNQILGAPHFIDIPLYLWVGGHYLLECHDEHHAVFLVI